MKRILITGKNSYVGNSFKEWINKSPEDYIIDKISLRDVNWRSSSFENYDVIIHAAAIVHSKEKNEDEYMKINRDLTLELAKKAKNEGVHQFIFLSTMGVYGVDTGYISESTLPNPKTFYAKSKHEAEQLLLSINSEAFNIAILRPPLVYGSGCPGNYRRLADIVKKAPLFPNVNNERSMIYIDNLSEFIRLIIRKNVSGLYFPQNKQYVQTLKLVQHVAEAHKKKIQLTNTLNVLVRIGMRLSSTFRKVFGTYVYDKKMSGGPRASINGEEIDYETISFKDSILVTEKNR